MFTLAWRHFVLVHIELDNLSGIMTAALLCYNQSLNACTTLSANYNEVEIECSRPDPSTKLQKRNPRTVGG